MENIAEDNTKLFCLWLRKHIKKDKRITGAELAALVKCHPSTISSYIRGRTRPEHDRQVEIQKHADVSWGEILKTGRLEQQAEIDATAHTHSPLSQARPQLSENNIHHIHQQIIEKFKQKALALEINEILLDIESIDPDELKVVSSNLKDKRHRLEIEQKKRASGDKR